MELKTELIQVVEQSGLEKTKGQKITETLSIFFDKAAEWQTTIESLTINSIEDIGKMKTAKEFLKENVLDKLVVSKFTEIEISLIERMMTEYANQSKWISVECGTIEEGEYLTYNQFTDVMEVNFHKFCRKINTNESKKSELESQMNDLLTKANELKQKINEL